MRSKQSGFTLIEIAIVLVIIGLLLGGVLKGQELINSAKVKNMATDFRNVPLFIYGYQDKYKALPGDHATVATAVTGASACTPAATAGHCVLGNGVIDGNWNDSTIADETAMFWQHVRLAGLAAGPTDVSLADYMPRNADGGQIGIESGSAARGGAFIGAIAGPPAIAALTPTYLVCSTGILGKYAKQLDTTLDDGNTQTGSLRVVATNHTRGNGALATTAVDDSTAFTVCMGL